MNDCWSCEHLEKRVGSFQYCKLNGRRNVDANKDRCYSYKQETAKVEPERSPNQLNNMAYTLEGTIEIDLVDFWTWVYDNHFPVPKGSEFQFGVPRINKDNLTMEIDFAADSESDPKDWKVKPKAVTQWCEAKSEDPTQSTTVNP